MCKRCELLTPSFIFARRTLWITIVRAEGRYHFNDLSFGVIRVVNYFRSLDVRYRVPAYGKSCE
jgi:hypothetical protein